jgi:hypothetical protein
VLACVRTSCGSLQRDSDEVDASQSAALLYEPQSVLCDHISVSSFAQNRGIAQVSAPAQLEQTLDLGHICSLIESGNQRNSFNDFQVLR